MINDHFLVLTLNLLWKVLMPIVYRFRLSSATNQDNFFLVELFLSALLDKLLALLPGFKWIEVKSSGVQFQNIAFENWIMNILVYPNKPVTFQWVTSNFGEQPFRFLFIFDQCFKFNPTVISLFHCFFKTFQAFNPCQ